MTKIKEEDTITSTAQADPLIPKGNLSKQAEPPLTDVGNGLINDSDANITWVADANLFRTQVAQSGNAAAFVTTIINDYGRPFFLPNSTITYSLTAADFDTNSGAMMVWSKRP